MIRRRLLTSWPVVLACIGAAVAINWRHFAGFLGAEGTATAPPAGAPPPPGAAAYPAPAAEALPAFAPVSLTAEVPDPFWHGQGEASGPAPSTGGLRVPRVELILLTRRSRRAVVEGAPVGVGDRLPIGTVKEIDATGVHVVTSLGATLLLPLREKGEAGAAAASGARQDAAGPAADPRAARSPFDRGDRR
jgi:hypothetical protein